MKKYFLYSIVIIICLTKITSAEVASNKTNDIVDIKQTITNIKQQATEEKNKIKAELASTTAEIKKVTQELKNEIEIKIGKKLDDQKIKIADVFEKTILNLKDLIARTESRISKMELDNIDVSSIRTLLETAKTKVSLAETELTNLENLLAQDIPTVSTSTIKNKERNVVLKNIKLQSEKTKSAIKAGHESIINVINSLKVGLMKKENSTSSPEKNITDTENTTNN